MNLHIMKENYLGHRIVKNNQKAGIILPHPEKFYGETEIATGYVYIICILITNACKKN